MLDQLCAVYRSSKKADTYLYVPGKDQFDEVPDALLKSFGKPQFVMLLPLHKREKLAQIDSQQLKQALQEKGFYLQLPPPAESLLKQHLASQKSHIPKEH